MQTDLRFSATHAITGETITHTETIEHRTPTELDTIARQLLMKIGQLGITRKENQGSWALVPGHQLSSIRCEAGTITVISASESGLIA
jgi:hypothetical protein